MKIQHWSLFSLLATSIIVSFTNLAYGESAASLDFFCQIDETMPKTLAKASNGETIAIFNWKKEVFPVGTDLQIICDTVSEQLEDYLVSENNLSSLTFTTVQINEIPVICVADAENKCGLGLLTLSFIAEEPIKAGNFVLNSVLNPQLEVTKTTSSVRGVQSTSYKVNIWDLLGF